MRTALLLGANGLVGFELLQRLAVDPAYANTLAFVRRPLVAPPGKVEEVIVDYDRPDTYLGHLAVDDVFCCLGTTIKKAGSQDAFRRVDFELPLALAKASLAAGAKRYLIVTAVTADAHASTFYNRVKGELEDALRALPFPGGVKLFRPSLLLGKREDSRAGEKVGAVVMRVFKPLLFGKLQRYRAITGAQVADAMINVAKADEPGLKSYEGAALFAAASS